MFWPCEHFNEAAKHELEPPLRLLRLELGNRRLLAYDELQLGDEVDHKTTVRAQRLEKRSAPIPQFGVALAEELSRKILKGLPQRRIGNAPLQQIELARREQAAGRNERLVQLVHDRGFANAGISGDQDQLRRAVR